MAVCKVLQLGVFLTLTGISIILMRPVMAFQRFAREAEFSGVAVSPNGQNVFVLSGKSVLRLNESLEVVEEEIPLPGLVIGMAVAEERSYLCWVDALIGSCEVRSANASRLIAETANSSKSGDSRSQTETGKFFMFPSGFFNALYRMQLALVGKDFVVGQPLPPPSSRDFRNRMTMARFDGETARVRAYLPLLVATPQHSSTSFLSAEQRSIDSFDAILSAGQYVYFIYALASGWPSPYSRRQQMSFVARVCNEDVSSGKPYGNGFPKDSYMTYVEMPIAKSTTSVLEETSIISSAILANLPILGQPGGEDIFITAFHHGGDFSQEKSALYALNRSVLDAQLDVIVSHCDQAKSGSVHLSPFTVRRGANCSSEPVRGFFHPPAQMGRRYNCSNAAGKPVKIHWPALFLPQSASQVSTAGELLFGMPTSARITSLLSTVVDNISLLWVSAEDGVLWKFQLTFSNGNLKALLYEDVRVDEGGRSVNQLVLSADKTAVFVLANKTGDSIVYRQPVVNCSLLATCQSCLSVSNGRAAIRNPLCGWCEASTKCMRRSKCPSQEKLQTSCQSLNLSLLRPSPHGTTEGDQDEGHRRTRVSPTQRVNTGTHVREDSVLPLTTGKFSQMDDLPSPAMTIFLTGKTAVTALTDTATSSSGLYSTAEDILVSRTSDIPQTKRHDSDDNQLYIAASIGFPVLLLGLVIAGISSRYRNRMDHRHCELEVGLIAEATRNGQELDLDDLNTTTEL